MKSPIDSRNAIPIAILVSLLALAASACEDVAPYSNQIESAAMAGSGVAGSDFGGAYAGMGAAGNEEFNLGGTGGMAGTAGNEVAGSSAATGGYGGTGGFGGTEIEIVAICAEGDCTEKKCEGVNIPPPIPTEGLDECSIVGCNFAHCVPESSIPTNVDVGLLYACDTPGEYCVPDDYTATMGQFETMHCASILGAEGRCISTCAWQVNGLMDSLPQDVCGNNERCAPCINPNDGKETGACSQGCDVGPSLETESDPLLFPTCQNGTGRCIAKELVPRTMTSHLLQLDCPGAAQLCCPIEKSQNLKYNFEPCTPTLAGIIATPGPDGQLGGCVPQWLADGNLFEGIFLFQETCEVGQKCAPCNNPMRGQLPTAACPVPLPTDPEGGLPPGTQPTDT